jgi:hypothetical protein
MAFFPNKLAYVFVIYFACAGFFTPWVIPCVLVSKLTPVSGEVDDDISL